MDFNFNIAFNSNKITALTEGKGEITSYVSWDNKYKTMPAYVSRIGESAGKMYGFIYEGTYKESDFNITTDDKGKKVYTLKEGIASYVKGCQPGDPKYKDMPTIDTNGDGIHNHQATVSSMTKTVPPSVTACPHAPAVSPIALPIRIGTSVSSCNGV